MLMVPTGAGGAPGGSPGRLSSEGGSSGVLSSSVDSPSATTYKKIG